jgi:hypothetical protein
VVVRTYNPRTPEPEAAESQLQGQPGPQREILSQKVKLINKNCKNHYNNN